MLVVRQHVGAMPGTIELAIGFKFAALAVPEVETGFGALALLDDGWAASTSLPEEALSTWKDGIGQFHADELSQTQLFLWKIAKSALPEVLDGENEKLKHSVYRLWLGVLLASPNLTCGRLTSLTGANADGTARVRSLQTYHRTWRTAGTTPQTLTLARLKLAAQLASALEVHPELPGHRMVRALRAFRQACESPELDVRLHQFVRCLEAFVMPRIGNSAECFADRLRELCAGRAHADLKECYVIRSGIEHLHGPFERMPKRLRGTKDARLALRAVQAEGMARYMLTYYLLHQSLWPH
jgi:hypothetical protein